MLTKVFSWSHDFDLEGLAIEAEVDIGNWDLGVFALDKGYQVKYDSISL